MFRQLGWKPSHRRNCLASTNQICPILTSLRASCDNGASVANAPRLSRRPVSCLPPTWNCGKQPAIADLHAEGHWATPLIVACRMGWSTGSGRRRGRGAQDALRAPGCRRQALATSRANSGHRRHRTGAENARETQCRRTTQRPLRTGRRRAGERWEPKNSARLDVRATCWKTRKKSETFKFKSEMCNDAWWGREHRMWWWDLACWMGCIASCDVAHSLGGPVVWGCRSWQYMCFLQFYGF